MSEQTDPRWLVWCKKLQAISQTGLAFSRDPYDTERYNAIREIAVEMLAAGSDVDITVIRNLISADTGYATPKVDVRGVVFRENRILLVRETSDGAWTLPGGWADVLESPAECVIKEIFEESGFRARAKKVLAIFDRSKHPHHPPFPYHIYKIFMLCELTGGSETPSIETDAIGFFEEHEIPKLSSTRITPWQIKRMFEHHRNPNLPTDFDDLEG